MKIKRNAMRQILIGIMLLDFFLPSLLDASIKLGANLRNIAQLGDSIGFVRTISRESHFPDITASGLVLTIILAFTYFILVLIADINSEIVSRKLAQLTMSQRVLYAIFAIVLIVLPALNVSTSKPHQASHAISLLISENKFAFGLILAGINAYLISILFFVTYIFKAKPCHG